MAAATGSATSSTLSYVAVGSAGIKPKTKTTSSTSSATGSTSSSSIAAIASSTLAATTSNSGTLVAQPNPPVADSRSAAKIKIAPLFQGLENQTETYIATANKCRELYKTMIFNQVKRSTLKEEMTQLLSLHKETTENEIPARIQEIVRFGAHRKEAIAEMTTEYQNVLTSLQRAVAEFKEIFNITQEDLKIFVKLGLQKENLAPLQEKMELVVEQIIEFEKLISQVIDLQATIPEYNSAYYALKGALQARLSCIPGQVTYTDSVAMLTVSAGSLGYKTSYPTVDRLRDDFLAKNPNFLNENRFREPAVDDHKGAPTDDSKGD